MEQIVQLRTMRDEALARLQANPDFKLVNSLDALIKDLEAVVFPVAVQTEVVEAPIVEASVVEAVTSEAVVVDEIASEIEAISAETYAPEAVEVPVAVETNELNEELSTLAEELPDDTAAAIEALEAELSQSPSLVDHDNSVDIGSTEPNSTIN